MVSADHVLTIMVITTPADHIPSWLDHVAGDAQAAVVPATLETVHDYLAIEIPDALILTTCDEACLECLQTLNEEYENGPTAILCAEHLPDERFNNLIDLIIPPIAHPLLSSQIRHAITQSQRRHALENEIADLMQSQANHQEAVADIEALKNAVVHNVAHELNTPLLQVKSAVALIAEDIENNTLVDYALRATARLEAAVKNITQLTASLNDMQLSPLMIGDLIDSALRDLRRAWERKEHLERVEVSLDEQLPPACGDRHGIAIVLQQLIDNALKFSDGKVRVKAHRRGEHIRITVRDYGIGIDHDEIEKIFDSFYQVDPKATRKYSGAGVGLANVRLILERHGLEIEVHSAKGKGSTFSFELPVADLE